MYTKHGAMFNYLLICDKYNVLNKTNSHTEKIGINERNQLNYRRRRSFLLIFTNSYVFNTYTVLTLEVWSKLAKCVGIMSIASKCAHDFDCDWQRVKAFSHCVTLIRFLLSQIISYSDAKVPVLVVMKCKRANVIYVYELIFLLHTSRSTECMSVKGGKVRSDSASLVRVHSSSFYPFNLKFKTMVDHPEIVSINSLLFALDSY